MKLSIIIISYNEKEYLANAIESCLNQNFEYQYEIIIGDDGSNDGSIDIINEYSKKYPNIIKSFVMNRDNIKNVIPSIRVSNILKRAFSIATGEYFSVLSGDDLFIDSSKMNNQILFLDNNCKYVSCYTNFKKIWNDGQEELVKMKADISETVFWSLCYMHISCFVFRRNVLNNILDNFCDDTGLIYSIFISGKTKKIDSVSFGYRQRDKSIMHDSDNIELSLLEILLYEDIIKKKEFINSSLSRFSKPLNYLFKNREKLDDSKYKKYIDFAMQNDSNIIYKIINYDDLLFFDKMKLRIKLFYSKLLRIIFLIILNVNKI